MVVVPPDGLRIQRCPSQPREHLDFPFSDIVDQQRNLAPHGEQAVIGHGQGQQGCRCRIGRVPVLLKK